MSSCPFPYFDDNLTQICSLDCSIDSLMLVINETRKCVSQCPAPYYANRYSAICSLNCPPGEYKSTFQQCSECNIECKECNGPSRFHCLSCQEGNFLYKNQCFAQCPFGMFIDPSQKFCISYCPGSTYPNQLTQVCEEDGFLCYFPNFFMDLLEKKCKRCHDSCKLCRGPSRSDCILCKDKYLLLSDSILSDKPLFKAFSSLIQYEQKESEIFLRKNLNSAHLISCVSCKGSNGFFLFDNLGICLPCLPNCKTCFTSGSCYLCNPNFYLDDQRKCALKTNISAELKSTPNPAIFTLTFDQD